MQHERTGRYLSLDPRENVGRNPVPMALPMGADVTQKTALVRQVQALP